MISAETWKVLNQKQAQLGELIIQKQKSSPDLKSNSATPSLE
jgi:hypothetical protein